MYPVSFSCGLLHNTDEVMLSFNPSVTSRVNISPNVEVYLLAKVYLVHLKVKHCQTLHVVHLQVKMSQPFLTVKKHCLVLLRVVKITVKMPLCTHLCQQSKQAVDWF